MNVRPAALLAGLLLLPLGVEAGARAVGPVPPALGAWLPHYRTALFMRSEQYDSLPADVGHYIVSRSVERVEPQRTLYRECERRIDRRKPTSCALTFAGLDGYGNAASVFEGRWDWFSPPQVVLPPVPTPGASWDSGHWKRGAASHRTCEVVADTSFCDDGVRSRCHTEFPASAVQITQHFCPGIGWVGEDALAQYEGGHVFSTFTFDVLLDGVPGPTRRPRPTSEPTRATY